MQQAQIQCLRINEFEHQEEIARVDNTKTIELVPFVGDSGLEVSGSCVVSVETFFLDSCKVPMNVNKAEKLFLAVCLVTVVV